MGAEIIKEKKKIEVGRGKQGWEMATASFRTSTLGKSGRLQHTSSHKGGQKTGNNSCA